MFFRVFFLKTKTYDIYALSHGIHVKLQHNTIAYRTDSGVRARTCVQLVTVILVYNFTVANWTHERTNT